MTIAQQFTAGETGKQGVLRPVGTLEPCLSWHDFNRPYGTNKRIFNHFRSSDESLGYFQSTLRVGIKSSLNSYYFGQATDILRESLQMISTEPSRKAIAAARGSAAVFSG
jgi:hypothetical protein